jgi:hypothetical protein
MDIDEPEIHKNSNIDIAVDSREDDKERNFRNDTKTKPKRYSC